MSDSAQPAVVKAVISPRLVQLQQRPRPRVLVHGDVPGAEKLTGEFRTIDFQPLNSKSVDRAAYDLLVTASKELGSVPTGVFVVSVGADSLEQAPETGMMIQFDRERPIGELAVPVALAPEIRELVASDLAPLLRGLGRSRELGANLGGDVQPRGYLNAFAQTSSEFVIAGEWQRRGNARGWALPPGVDVARWVKVAVKLWRSIAPDRFPEWKQWESNRAWMSAKQLLVADELDHLAEQRRAAIAGFDERRALLDRRMEDATVEAAAFERVLLTGQGDALKDAVSKALGLFGFDVEDVDATRERGDHLEDLRVRDSTRPGWVALVEIRGYARGGAKSSDLMRVGRFVERYVVSTGRVPDARWYVVSQACESDPSERDEAFAAQPDDLRAFEQAGGLVVDAREMFRLIRRVQTSATSKEAARDQLRASRGRLGVTS